LNKFGTSEKQTEKNNIPVLLDPGAKVRGEKQAYVSRELMELAYKNDIANQEAGQDLDTIIRRGGYSSKELSELLKPEVDRINAELATLKSKPATTPTVPDAIAAAIAAQQAEKKAAAEKAAATETVEQEVWKRHLVKKGETLKALAGKYGTTVEAIKKANNLKSNFIREGMTLKIKMKVKKQVAKEAPATPAAVPATTPQATTEAPSSLADLEALIAATEGSDPSLLDEDIVSLQTVSVDGIEYEKSEITYSFLIELGKTSQEANEILKEIC
jgi:LysM repeat protein